MKITPLWCEAAKIYFNVWNKYLYVFHTCFTIHVITGILHFSFQSFILWFHSALLNQFMFFKPTSWYLIESNWNDICVLLLLTSFPNFSVDKVVFSALLDMESIEIVNDFYKSKILFFCVKCRNFKLDVFLFTLINTLIHFNQGIFDCKSTLNFTLEYLTPEI